MFKYTNVDKTTSNEVKMSHLGCASTYLIDLTLIDFNRKVMDKNRLSQLDRSTMVSITLGSSIN